MNINSIKFHKDDPKDSYNINVDINITMTWEEMLETNMNPRFKTKLQEKIQEAIDYYRPGTGYDQ